MAVFTRPDSKYYWLWLPRKNGKAIRERTDVLALPEHRDLAEKVYRARSKELAKTEHFAPRKLQRGRSDASGWTYIYFVTDGELIKIGRAVNVLARLRAMQTSHVAPLTVLAAFLGHVSLEGVIQQRFRHLRVRREWFRRDSELDGFIAAVRTGGDLITPLVTPLPSRFRLVRRSAK